MTNLRVLFLLFLLAVLPHATAAQQAKAGQAPAVASDSKESKSAATKAEVSETLIDSSIPDDPAFERLLQPYSAKVRALDVLIGKLEGELRKGGAGAGSLGNFVADGIRTQGSLKLGRPVIVAVTNSGGLRKNTITEGDLLIRDIFELLPFENALVETNLTGEQLLKLLSVVVAERDAQSGARLKYREVPERRPELVSATLIDAKGQETAIDPKANYLVISVDYLMNRGGSYAILKEGKDVRPLGLTTRDAIMDYVKAETAAGRSIKSKLDRRFLLEAPPKSTLEVQP